MLVLGIESTCDETASAVVRDGRDILSNVITSQIDLHAEYGGVVPELSCRRHVDVIIPVIEKSLHEAKVTLQDIDLIAVAHGPGLIGALLIGLTAAKTLSLALDKPFVGVNHIEAHLYAALMSQPQPVTFPCMGVILSGGHTALVRMDDVGCYTLVGETIDDAIGEAFDKVAKMMDLPYPGGPQIEKLAVNGNRHRYNFKPGKVKNNPFSFSFSGLKTAVLYGIKGQNCNTFNENKPLSEQDKADAAAAFQHAAFKDIINKSLLAAKEHSCNTLIFGGGVTNNMTLRQLFNEQAGELNLLWPSLGLSLDNAAMIAGLGYHVFKKKGKGDTFELPAATRIAF
ncbi:MAG: tRNA (adenosine(37)-N6)-threonylcarbamoyltransferase complex transferase subunit TsaD [Parachlamydiaceae bacterium]|nr:tRNA (adenosine(37)-N6)-threonylcarbamoyltransferase complex transferase subunit TsaD [Parachlamydiaceae bacterium]